MECIHREERDTLDRATWIYVYIGYIRINEDFLLSELGNVTAAKCSQGRNILGLDIMCLSTPPRTAEI